MEINTLVFSKLCYCSSILSNAAVTNLFKLQAVRNFASWIICGSRILDDFAPLRKKLHWLPFESQLYLRDAWLRLASHADVLRLITWEARLRSSLSLFEVSNTWRRKWLRDQKHAVDVVMARGKRIYILIIKVNKLFSFFSWKNTKKLWKHSPAARVPTAFLVLPNFQSCLYNRLSTAYSNSILLLD